MGFIALTILPLLVARTLAFYSFVCRQLQTAAHLIDKGELTLADRIRGFSIQGCRINNKYEQI